MLHEGEVAGGGEGEEPAFALTLLLCQITRYGECREGEPFDCSGIIDEEAEALLVLEVVLSEGEAQLAQLTLDLAQSLLLLGRELGTALAEAFVAALEEAQVFGVELEALTCLPYLTDTLEEGLGEGDEGGEC